MSNTQKEIFRFTRVWRDLITLLHEQVALRRHKYLIRSSIGPVFSGSNAVDVLHRHIKANPGMFPNQEFGRSNCVRLCQRFLDLRVFFPSKDKSTLKILFDDSNFVFYRFNYNNDYLGAPVLNRSLKRSNSETDLLSVLPVKKPARDQLSKQISNLSTSLIANRIRKSIRRRSSTKPDPNLSTIVETRNFDQTICEVSENAFEAGLVENSTPRQSRKSIERSNAFRSRRSEDSFSLRSMKVSSVSIHSVKSSKFQIATPILESRRKSLNKLCNRNGSKKGGATTCVIESRKKVKNVSNFNLSLSLAL